MAAAERSEVLSLFDALDGLSAHATSLRVEGKAQKKQTQEVFLRQCDEVLAKFLQYRNAGFEPARIFYQRMADSQTVMTEEHHAEYMSALETYRSFAGKKRSSDLLGMATVLLAYCNTHRLDPDNSLIGLSPSLRALQSCTEEERAARKRSVMAEGDLLLVEVTTDQESEARWRYARVARPASEGDDLVAVYMLPEEKSREEVSVRAVRTLSSWVLQNLGQAKSMQRLVCDPFETFVQRLQDDVKSATHAFLASQHLDVDLLEDVVNKPNEAPPLSALPRLRQLIGGLLALNSRLDLLSAFYDDVNAAADLKIEAFLADIENQRVFLPMKAANLAHLETFNFSSFATNRIRMCYGRCDACMDTMKLALKDLTNGQAKQRLTQWWLEKIELETTALLRSKKYAFDAYPSEYLQAPPENIQPVKFNLQLIREILNPLDDKHGIQEFVARLKGEIYPRIDEFILSALVALNQVVPTVPTHSPAPDVAELEALVAAAAVSKQDSERLQWMTELVKDLKYLARMRQLETSGERVLDVVPISGLVLSQFYRLENELKTVIELWDSYLQEQAQMKGGKAYQRLKTKIYLWKITDTNKIDVMKEFGGTSCIMQIETGGFFSAALTEHGEVYAWGKGLSGELGIGEKKHSDEPVQVEALKGKKVIQISCGGAACAAVTSDGELYLWGFFVVLGAPLLNPTVVDAAQFNHVRIREVSLGPQHMLVLLDSGELYVWGKGNRGQLGLGQLKDRDKPSLLEGDLRSRKIKRVRAGEDISAAVTEAGELYVWGKNDDQLLGVDSSEKSVDRPTRLSQLSGRVADVAVGSRHLVALTEAGEVYTWGSYLRPALVDNLPSRPLMIACGQQHSVVCTETDVVTWKFTRSAPSGEDGNAGSQRRINPNDKDKKSQRVVDPTKPFPKRDLEVIEELRGKHVLQVACGSLHTTVLVENPAFFGVPLATVMEREKGRRVPSMVQKICAYLLNRVATEGLFRVAGRAAQVQELRNDFDRDEDVNLFRCRDPHTVTSLLKDYLRLLPEPLVPYDHVDAFLSLGDATATRASEAARFTVLCQLVDALPISHRALLEYLLVFWSKVASRCVENKMNAQALAIALAPVVFRRKDGVPSGLTKEAAILSANTVLRWLITWGRAYAEETPESLAQQAQLWATQPQGRADVWQLWALRIGKEAAIASTPALAPSGFVSFSVTLLSSAALDAALSSAVAHDLDVTEAQTLNSLCGGLFRSSDLSPQHIEALEQQVREAQSRASSARNVSEDRLDEFVAEEALKARNAAGLVTARLALLSALTRQANRLRALVRWAQSSQALSIFRAHRWPLESGWRLLEAAGAEIAPVLLRGFNATELAVELGNASAREIDEAQASITAAEAFVEIRRTQLGQLSFARKKLQSAQQAGNASAVHSLNSKLVLMRDAFLPLADSQATAPGLLVAPLTTCALPAAMEQRRTSLLTAAGKLEAALSELKSKP